MATKVIKETWNIDVGTAPNTVRLSYGTKLELLQSLKDFGGFGGTAQPMNLVKSVYSWDDSTKKVTVSSVELSAGDL